MQNIAPIRLFHEPKVYSRDRPKHVAGVLNPYITTRNPLGIDHKIIIGSEVFHVDRSDLERLQELLKARTSSFMAVVAVMAKGRNNQYIMRPYILGLSAFDASSDLGKKRKEKTAFENV